MAYFKVMPLEMQNDSDEIASVASALQEKAEKLNGIESIVGNFSSHAKRSARRARQEIVDCAAELRNIASSLETIRHLYGDAEAKSLVNAGKIFKTKDDNPNLIIGDAQVFGKIALLDEDFMVKNYDRKRQTEFGRSSESKYIYDEKTKKYIKQEKKDKDKNKKDIKSKLKDITLYEQTYQFLDEPGTVLYETEDGGRISYNSKDVYIKNKLTAGSIQAEIGAKYGLLSFEQKGQLLGDDNLGVHYSTKADFLSASTSAGFSIGWINSDSGLESNLVICQADF